MPNPQQPEIARSRRTPGQDPDSAATLLEGQRVGGDDGPRGAVPPDNQPGHHPAAEQDRPDLNAFAEQLGTVDQAAADAGDPEGDAAP